MLLSKGDTIKAITNRFKITSITSGIGEIDFPSDASFDSEGAMLFISSEVAGNVSSLVFGQTTITLGATTAVALNTEYTLKKDTDWVLVELLQSGGSTHPTVQFTTAPTDYDIEYGESGVWIFGHVNHPNEGGSQESTPTSICVFANSMLTDFNMNRFYGFCIAESVFWIDPDTNIGLNGNPASVWLQPDKLTVNALYFNHSSEYPSPSINYQIYIPYRTS